LLPFMGKAHVAYLPRGKVVGVSKLARVVELCSRQPQVQERVSGLHPQRRHRRRETAGITRWRVSWKNCCAPEWYSQKRFVQRFPICASVGTDAGFDKKVGA
jgi:hypothetical protein